MRITVEYWHCNHIATIVHQHPCKNTVGRIAVVIQLCLRTASITDHTAIGIVRHQFNRIANCIATTDSFHQFSPFATDCFVPGYCTHSGCCTAAGYCTSADYCTVADYFTTGCRTTAITLQLLCKTILTVSCIGQRKDLVLKHIGFTRQHRYRKVIDIVFVDSNHAVLVVDCITRLLAN